MRYFKHFKGGLYKFIAIAKDSETLENMVIYQALYGENGLWVRSEKMFFERIIRDGAEINRFTELTEGEIQKILPELKNNKEIK